MITTTYGELFTMDALYKSHLRARRTRRGKRPVVRFELSLLSNISDLHSRLNSDKFTFGNYNTFIVYEPKRREIQNLRYSDRIVQHLLCDKLLMPYFSSLFIVDNCVCQKGKGMHFALRRFERMLRKFIGAHGVNGWFLKCDILKYFPSVRHDILKSAVCPHIGDVRLRAMIEGIIDGYHTSEEYLDKYGIPSLGSGDCTERGIPIGNQTSQIFGMYYLDPIDRLIKERLGIRAYSRYMDDFILIHHDKNYLRQVRDAIIAKAEALGLRLNSKTHIFPITNGVTYLGYRYCVMPTGRIIKTVKKRTKRRFRWRARLLKKACLDGVIQPARVLQSLSALHGHLKHGRNRKFEAELYSKLRFAIQPAADNKHKNNL